MNAFYSYSTDIYQIEFCYLTSFCKHWHCTHIYNRFLSVLPHLNVSTGNVISYYGWKCTCTSCAAKHKKAPAKFPESLNRPTLHYCYGSNIHLESAGKRISSNTLLSEKQESDLMWISFLFSLSAIYTIPFFTFKYLLCNY